VGVAGGAVSWATEPVPFVAYVREKDSGSGPDERPAWEPNWRIWRWIALAVPVLYAATEVKGAVEALLVLIVFGLVCRAAVEALPDGDGLRQHRQ
jgi:hypothetical protein